MTGMTLTCILRTLAKDMAEQEGESLEAMEHMVLGIVKDILESNRDGDQ